MYCLLTEWQRKVKHCAVRMWNKGSGLWKELSDLLWRICYLHINKVVIFTVMVTAVMEVGLSNYLPVFVGR